MEDNLTHNETLIEDGHANNEREQVERLQQCYRDILTGVIGACVKNRVHPCKKDLGTMVQNIREFISETAYDVLVAETDVLRSNEEQDIERTYEAIVDSFRVKALDYSPFYRALAPTNPATLASKGEGV